MTAKGKPKQFPEELLFCFSAIKGGSMLKRLFLVLMCAVLITPAARCFAEQLTLQLVKQKVIEATAILESQGRAAFSQIRDPKGDFRFAEGQGYIWIHNIDGLMVVHPAKPELEGTPQLGMQDSTGFRFIVAMNTLVKEDKQGWVAYRWPKPGTHEDSEKVSFVKLATIEGRPYVVGCGMYDAGEAEAKQAFPGDIVVTMTSQQKE
jgi:methyl-accepting chemotaxis protein